MTIQFSKHVVLVLLLVLFAQEILRAQNTLKASVFEKRGFSYYPKEAAWDSMWTRFDSTVIDRDFQLARSLGANSVRLIVRTLIFGFPIPQPKFIKKLDTTLEIADRNQLMVSVTLFDGFAYYSKIDSSKQWIDSLVSRYANDRRIYLWELRNQLNQAAMDDGKEKVLNWYRQLFPHLKSKIGVNQKATVSLKVDTLNFDFFREIKKPLEPDIYDMHYYLYNASFFRALDSVRSIIGPNKELRIGEFGEMGGFGFTKLEQRDKYRNLFCYMSRAGIKDIAFWILYDFKSQNVPELTRKPANYYFGIFDSTGAAKPAAEVVRMVYQGNPPDSLDFGISNGSFENVRNIPSPKSSLGLINGFADSWSVWQPDGGSSKVSLDSTVSFLGKRSIKVENSNQVRAGALYYQGIPVVPDKSYELTGYIKTANATGASNILIAWFDRTTAGKAGFISNTYSDTVLGTVDWKLVRATGKAPSKAILAKIYCQSYNNSGFAYFDGIIFKGECPTVVLNTKSLNSPKDFRLYQSYPNPFNSGTTIGYSLPRTEIVTLTIYNITGQLVRTIVNERQAAGHYSVYWDGTDKSDILVANGIYVYVIRTSGFTATQKMIVLRTGYHNKIPRR
jgi:hypothetical protein